MLKGLLLPLFYLKIASKYSFSIKNFSKDSTCAGYLGHPFRKPETLLPWHRELFRLFWKHKSKVHARKPRLSSETISLIKQMAANNRLWGAEGIRGELLKLGIRVSKRTIQKYMKHARPKRACGQNMCSLCHFPLADEENSSSFC
jgi:hypothetical protein